MKLTIQSINSLAGIQVTSVRALLVMLSLSLFVAEPAPVFAVDAVWLSDPGSGDWNTGSNWSTSPNAPIRPGDTATFNTSMQTSLTVSGSAEVDSITFNPGASAFTISTTNGHFLGVQGVGLVNISGKTQAIINNGGALTGAPSGITELLERLDCRQRDDNQQRRSRGGQERYAILRYLDCWQRGDHQQRRRS